MDIRIYFFLSVLIAFCSLNVNAQSVLNQSKEDHSAELDEEKADAKPYEYKWSKTVNLSEETKREQGEEFLCEAELFIEYDQYDDEVKVQTFVSVNECQDAYGEYVIKVYLDDDSGESKIQKFTEVWRHTGVNNSNEEVVSEHFYSINSGAYVSRVRGSLSSDKACWCRHEIAE